MSWSSLKSLQNFGKTTGPIVIGTVAFTNLWNEKKLGIFLSKSAIEDDIVLDMIDSFAESMGGRLETLYDLDFARDDYKELIELSLIFLGKLSPRFLKPLGPVSNARWMGKLILIFKKYLLRDHVDLDAIILDKIKLFLSFALEFYILHFFAVTSFYSKRQKRCELVETNTQSYHSRRS